MPRKESIKKELKEKYKKKALKLGALHAKLIPAKTIVAAAWVRMKCQYGCDGYGQCLTCPPYSPSPDQTKKILANYKTALIVHGDDHADVTDIVATIEREAFLDGHYKAFAMGSGPCRLCRSCNLEDEECRHPDKARPAMEACGIDVFLTARNNSFPIKVAKNQDCEQDYYGVVLLE